MARRYRARGWSPCQCARRATIPPSDVTDLAVGLVPAGTISGRVVTDDGTPLRSLIQVAAVLVDEGKEIDEYRRDRTDVTGEGTFVLKGLFDQRVIRLAGFTDGWRIARVTIGKDDVTTVSVPAGTTVDDIVIVITRSAP